MDDIFDNWKERVKSLEAEVIDLKWKLDEEMAKLKFDLDRIEKDLESVENRLQKVKYAD